MSKAECKGVNETHFASNISGTSLPHTLWGASVIEHEDSFLILGGNTGIGGGTTYSDKLLIYNSEGQWVEVPTPLSERKYFLTAINVNATIFQSC